MRLSGFSCGIEGEGDSCGETRSVWVCEKGWSQEVGGCWGADAGVVVRGVRRRGWGMGWRWDMGRVDRPMKEEWEEKLTMI